MTDAINLLENKTILTAPYLHDSLKKVFTLVPLHCPNLFLL